MEPIDLIIWAGAALLAVVILSGAGVLAAAAFHSIRRSGRWS